MAELLALWAEYAGWLEALPDIKDGSTTADAHETITNLDLDTLADIRPPEE